MIDIWLEQIDSRWFGVALDGTALVATAAAQTPHAVKRAIVGSLPAEAPRAFLEGPTPAAKTAVCMLAELERGHEEGKDFELSAAWVPEPLAGVLRAAAAIPLGYVCTYGSIAKAAHSDARTVGRVMATNPLYPIVPCHRVVGADLSLVGYGGSQKEPALRAKLDRLRAERKGFAGASTVGASGMEIVPVEWAIAKAARDGMLQGQQLSLW